MELQPGHISVSPVNLHQTLEVTVEGFMEERKTLVELLALRTEERDQFELSLKRSELEAIKYKELYENLLVRHTEAVDTLKQTPQILHLGVFPKGMQGVVNQFRLRVLQCIQK